MTNYKDQSISNLVCLFEDIEYRERKEALFKLSEALKAKNVEWAVGCSMNLFLRGIVDDFHDIDIIVDIESIPKVKEIMEEWGYPLLETGGNGFCESDVYLHYQLDRVDVDFIAGFRVNTFGTSYHYKYDKNEIDMLEILDMEVPAISMEAMYILYYMMEGWQPRRKFKRMLIEQYFQYNQYKHLGIFKKALAENNLPGQIRWAIRALITR